VLATPSKTALATQKTVPQYHVPKRPMSIRDQILANSNTEETKAKATKHKLHVPRHQKPKKVKKQAPPASRARPTQQESEKPKESPKAIENPPVPKREVKASPQQQATKSKASASATEKPAATPKTNKTEATQQKTEAHKVALLKEQSMSAKHALSLAAFYNEEDTKDSEKTGWHFAAHFLSDAPAPVIHKTQERKVASLLDRQAQTTGTRWQATLAETQREVQEARQDNRIAISDQFSGLENKDKDIEQEQRREDRAARVDAAAESPVFDPKYHSDQVHLSKAFSALEQQDHAIDQYMMKAGDDADLSKIRNFQDESMNKISTQLKRVDEHPEEGHLPPLPVGRAFLETPLHDQWATFEKTDSQSIKDIKRDPNLRAFIQRGVTSRHH